MLDCAIYAYAFDHIEQCDDWINAEVSEAADVAVGTTKKTYKDLYPYASRIIPSWFVKLEDLKKLRIP